MTDENELRERITHGQATDAELEEFFGVDLMNELAAQWRGPDATDFSFAQWYNAVMRPIGVPRELARRMFAGEMAVDDFANALSDELQEAFLEGFPGLQADYQTKIDSGEVIP